MTGDVSLPDLPDPQGINDEPTARLALALAQVHLAVAEYNEDVADPEGQLHIQGMFGKKLTLKPAEDIVAKVQEWLGKLYDAVKKIVQTIAAALTFSITIGSQISVTVQFGGN
jgi:hypothetical protein